VEGGGCDGGGEGEEGGEGGGEIHCCLLLGLGFISWVWRFWLLIFVDFDLRRDGAVEVEC
jgi:hypothetical protein